MLPPLERLDLDMLERLLMERLFSAGETSLLYCFWALMAAATSEALLMSEFVVRCCLVTGYFRL